MTGVGGTVGTPMTFEGYASDRGCRIRAVQFSMDGGETWTTYETPGTVAERDLYWKFEYTPQVAGTYELLVRPVGEDGTPAPIPALVSFWAE